MRPFTSTIPFDQALRILLDAAQPIEGVERLALTYADGRVAARDVVAGVDVPAFDRAAMDGYAVIAEDTAGATPGSPKPLSCVERVFTGQMPSRHIGRGECAEVATGAPMPQGATAVVMVEDTTRDGDQQINILAPAKPRQNIGRRAGDIAAGDVVISAGSVITPSRIGAIAATGVVNVEVYRRPSVAILVTGDEIVEPGGPIGPGQVYNVNQFTLAAVVRRHGGVAVPQRSVADSLDSLSQAIETARGQDLIVFSGGSSVGERDLVIDALQRHGEVLFHGIAVKPGKPTAFGRIGRTPVFGMPGYPTSCLSNAYMLLVPFLRRVARLPEWRPIQVEVPLSRRISSAPGRHQFYTVRIVNGHAEPAFKASGDITSMANADGYIEIPADVESVEKDRTVTVTLFE